MRTRIKAFALCACALLLANVVASCGGSYEETIAGVKIPVPNGMKRTGDKPVEISLFGFGAGQATFRGDVAPDKIVEFYKKEMPARGWQQSMKVQSGGAMLAYTKEGKTVLVGVGTENKETILNLTVGGTSGQSR